MEQSSWFLLQIRNKLLGKRNALSEVLFQTRLLPSIGLPILKIWCVIVHWYRYLVKWHIHLFSVHNPLSWTGIWHHIMLRTSLTGKMICKKKSFSSFIVSQLYKILNISLSVTAIIIFMAIVQATQNCRSNPMNHTWQKSYPLSMISMSVWLVRVVFLSIQRYPWMFSLNIPVTYTQKSQFFV